MPSVAPFEFTRVSAAAVAFDNLLVRKRPTLRLEQPELALGLRPHTPAGSLAGGHWLHIEFVGGNAWVTLERVFLRELLTPVLQGVDLEELPPPLAEAAIAAALGPALAELAGRGGIDARFSGLRAPPGDAAAGALLTLEERPAPVGRLLLDQAGLATARDMLTRLPDAASAGWNALPFDLRVTLCGPRLALAQIRSVECQDILLLPVATTGDRVQVQVQAGRRPLFAGHVDQDRLAIERLLEPPMSEDTSRPEEPTPLAESADAIELELCFELGRLRLTLGELRKVQPGHSFALDDPLEQPVLIRANGTPIGRGEILRIDDRLGVRVSSLFPTGDD